MARAILGVTDSAIQVDHRNGDTLDNRRENLRIASPTQNSQNRKIHRNNTSGIKGVDWNGGSWRVRVHAKGVSFFIGRFDTLEEAHKAHEIKVLELHQEFARV